MAASTSSTPKPAATTAAEVRSAIDAALTGDTAPAEAISAKVSAAKPKRAAAKSKAAAKPKGKATPKRAAKPKAAAVATTKPAPFALPKGEKPADVLIAFLLDKALGASDKPDAAAKDRPYVTAKGKAHVHARWLLAYMRTHERYDGVTLRDVSKLLRDALGFKHRSLPTPGAKTARMALWVGDVPKHANAKQIVRRSA
jgi:hypothetical protein